MRITPVCSDLTPLRANFNLVGPSSVGFAEEPPANGFLLFAPVPPWESVRIADARIEPWKMVCSLEADFNGNVFRGTGWFVGPKTVVTAGHCLWHPARGRAGSCKVTPGLYDGPQGGQILSPFGEHVSSRFSFPDEWTTGFLPHADFAAIHLEVAPIGGASFGMDSERYPAIVGTTVNVAGYPTEFGGAELHHSNDKVESVIDRLVTYRVDTLVGQSGAPVYVLGDDGMPYVQAIHAYGANDAIAIGLGINVNFGPLVSPEIVQLIKTWIEEA